MNDGSARLDGKTWQAPIPELNAWCDRRGSSETSRVSNPRFGTSPACARASAPPARSSSCPRLCAAPSCGSRVWGREGCYRIGPLAPTDWPHPLAGALQAPHPGACERSRDWRRVAPATAPVRRAKLGDLLEVLVAPTRSLPRLPDLGRLGFAHPLAVRRAVWYVEEKGAHQGGDQAQQCQPVKPTRKAAR